MVKKLKRQEAWAESAFGVASPPVVRYSFATINGAHHDTNALLTWLLGAVADNALGGR